VLVIHLLHWLVGLYVEAVGIPLHKETPITNLNEKKWEVGFDSDGE
jgi:hypothetical protein